jgi:hypothetical protein
MNIFYLSNNPVEAAKEHCDKHVVKMVIEYAQLLSTAHRVLDGEMYLDKTANNRSIKRWLLEDTREDVLYKASHINHPSAVWARESNNNYNWLYCLFTATCDEYTYRYGKLHETDRKLRDVLATPPKNIEVGYFKEPPQCMPYLYKSDKAVKGYRRYYIEDKADFAKWTKRNIPEWFKNANLQLS